MLTSAQVRAQASALGLSMGVTLYQACAIDRLADVLAGIAATYQADLKLAVQADARNASVTTMLQNDSTALQALITAALAQLASTPKA